MDKYTESHDRLVEEPEFQVVREPTRAVLR